MKILLSVLFLANFFSSASYFIKGKGFEGYIFSIDHFVLIDVKGQSYRPDEKDINAAERLLKENLKSVNTPSINQGNKGCPVIHKNLKKYVRQYIGVINENGDKVLWVNFVWKSGADRKRLSEDIETVLDGCSRYWNIKINVDEGILYDLRVNGEA
ncbi:hypothetical protein [Sphingobacterium sp. LRF_L2]|uniref:hypothetical protein n=1 Tax=Sphingobacterium sp. LRF_L2 TaxID=3369421 RepID=UPI003F6387C7